MSIYRVVISMHENYELDFSQGAFGELLGYEKIILKGKKGYVGKFVPNITRGVDWVYWHCDLITRRSNNVPSDVLYSFSTTGLQVSYPFQKEPRRLEWQPVNKSYIINKRKRNKGLGDRLKKQYPGSQRDRHCNQLND